MICLLDRFNEKNALISINMPNGQFFKISKIFALAYDGKVEEFRQALTIGHTQYQGVNQSLVTWIAFSRNLESIHRMLSALYSYDKKLFTIYIHLHRQILLTDLIFINSFVENNHPHSTKSIRDPIDEVCFFIEGYVGNTEWLNGISVEEPDIPKLKMALCGAAMADQQAFVVEFMCKNIQNEVAVYESIQENSLKGHSASSSALANGHRILFRAINYRHKLLLEKKLMDLVQIRDAKGIESNLKKAKENKIEIDQDVLQWILLNTACNGFKDLPPLFIQNLLQIGANPRLGISSQFISESYKSIIDTEDLQALTPLEMAILGQNVDAISIFLAHCKNLRAILDNVIKGTQYSGFQLIHLAALIGNYEIMQRLIKLGANLSIAVNQSNKNYKGFRPIQIAILQRNYTIVELLIRDHKVDALSGLNEQSLIQFAKEHSDENMVRLLVEGLSKKIQGKQFKSHQAERSRKLLPEGKSMDEILQSEDMQEIRLKVQKELGLDPKFFLSYCSPSSNTLKILHAVTKDQPLNINPNIIKDWGEALLKSPEGSKEFWIEAQEAFANFFKLNSKPLKKKRVNANKIKSLNDSFTRRALIAENTFHSKQSLLKELIPAHHIDWVKTLNSLSFECKTHWKNGKFEIEDMGLLKECTNELLSSYKQLKMKSNAFLQKALLQIEKFSNPYALIVDQLCNAPIIIDVLKIQESVKGYYNQEHDRLFQEKIEVEQALSLELNLLKNELSQLIVSMQQEKANNAIRIKKTEYLSMPVPDEKFVLKKQSAQDSINAISSLWKKRSEEFEVAQTLEEFEAIDSKYREEIEIRFTSKRDASKVEESEVVQNLLKQRAADQEKIEELFKVIALHQDRIQQLQNTPQLENEELYASSIVILQQQINEELNSFEPTNNHEKALKKKFKNQNHPLTSVKKLIKNYTRMGYNETTGRRTGSHRYFICHNAKYPYNFITIANHGHESIKDEIRTGLKATLSYIQNHKSVDQ